MLSTATGRLWLPFTQMDDFDASERTFVRGEGNYLVDAQGRRIFDAVSSIWTTVHGHCHPHIAEAIAKQASTLDHATLLGAANPVAGELANRLTALLNLDYAFFSGDGASAVEAALKMALQYWRSAGEPLRTRFVHLVDSYHGDTAAAMSVSDIAVFKSRYGAVTFETLSYDGDASLLQADDIAAVIVEPIVQAAAGMRIVPVDRYEPLSGMKPLLVVDEIATGFGRTGTMFAHEQLDLRPDIVCVGKGLTGGTLALSAAVVTARVYDAFRGPYGERKQFFHGHSYAGNPIACAAALANLDLFEKETTLARVTDLAAAIQPQLARLRALGSVRETREAGLMIGVEIDEQRVHRGDAVTPAWRIAGELYERGHFTRPIGDVIQLVPPLSSTQHEVRTFLGDLIELLAAG
ncbi:MAG TPA: aminotransferase class III-fold pyridoxal phosphate-dependent enzyme [Candidatus Baltobacteraceae bacterium]|nr:aminotransferase class III-fold pyridoxal phosphate-dependent enzyme [Candidatus Baltobacteraceae bacterium]